MVRAREPVEIAHRQAMTASVQEIADTLDHVLSRRLTAYIADVRSGKTVGRWSSGEVVQIRDHRTEQRLRTAYEIVALLSDVEHPTTIRSWFIGMNPQLDDTAPADVIREGRCRDALAAARHFLANG